METVIHTSEKAIAFEQNQIYKIFTITFNASTKDFIKIDCWENDMPIMLMMLDKKNSIALASFINKHYRRR